MGFGGNMYYPFGMMQPGRTYSAGNQHRYAMNGQELTPEIASNTTTALFWEYDSRIGKRWNTDPKPTIGISPYNCFGGNPIFYGDYLGDKIKGSNQKSANRMLDEIQKTFKGDKAQKLRDLFKLSSDKLTMSSISEKDFTDAVAGLSKDAQQLAYSYFNAINDKNSTQTVEMVYLNETLSAKGQIISGESTVAGLDGKWGGGVTGNESGNKNSYAVIVMNSITPTRDNKSSSTNGYSSIVSSAQELLAHEVLGHGFGYAKGTSTFGHADAIQMTNLYRRTQGINTYRDGAGHGTTVILLSNAIDAPPYAQIPQSMQTQITAIENAQKEIERKAAERAALRIKIMRDLNSHNDRLVNPISDRSRVLPMGGW